MVRNVGLGYGEPPRVLVTAPIDPLAGVVVFGGLREAQYAVLVAHAAEQHIGVLEVLAQVARHACRRLAVPYAEVEAEFNLALELVGDVPHPFREVEVSALTVLKRSKNTVLSTL